MVHIGTHSAALWLCFFLMGGGTALGDVVSRHEGTEGTTPIVNDAVMDVVNIDESIEVDDRVLVHDLDEWNKDKDQEDKESDLEEESVVETDIDPPRGLRAKAPSTPRPRGRRTPKPTATRRPTTPKSSRSCKKGGKKGKDKGKCSTSNFDLDKDGDEDLDDLILVLRSISDPLQIFSPGDLAGDVNSNGVADIDDAVAMIVRLTEVLGAEALGKLTATYFQDDTNFPWDQPSLPPDARRRTRINDDVPPSGTSSLVKGSGSKPMINWDYDNCKLDSGAYAKMSLKEKAEAFASWVKYGALALGASVPAAGLLDGVRAYKNYRSNTGNDLSVVYEKAINEDSLIEESVSREIAGVKADVKKLFTKDAFQFHASNARSVPNGATENWQKALGGHRIWSEGSVVIDQTDCELDIDFNIFMEDYYNFNPGQTDIASGLPDDDNCLFAVLGWAKPFFSRGSVSVTTEVDLECCKDEDCTASGKVCRDYKCVLTCPGTQQSGGQGTTSFSVDLTKSQGTFTVEYNMYSVPDELTVSYEGSTVFSTGGLVSGSATINVSYGSATSTSTTVDVVVSAPLSGTAWDVSVTCAE